MSMTNMISHMFHRKTQLDTPPPLPARARAPRGTSADQFGHIGPPVAKRVAPRPVPLAHVKRGDKVGQGCWFSDKNIIAPLCGTCINMESGAKGLICFCCPLCFGDR